jgi:membrane protease YdiL (CAAX protease family)
LLWSAPALVIAFSLSDQDQLRRLLLPAKNQKALTAWYLAALLFFPLIYGLGHRLSLAAGDAAPITLNGGPAEIALTIAATFIYMALFGGALGEETGLRGFGLPRLQQKFSPLLSALFLSLAWSLWMLPLYFNGAYQALLDGALEVMLLRGAANFFVVIILIWLYNRTGGNLLACILLHASYTTAAAFLAPGWTAILVQAVAALALAAQAKMWQRLPEVPDETV